MTTMLDNLLRERQETWEATRALSEQADKRADKAFTPAEQRTWDARNADLDRFDRNIAELQGQDEQHQRAAEASRGAGRLIRPDTGSGTAERTASGHTLLRRSDSFAQHAGKLGLNGGTEDQGLSLGRYLRGFVTGQWDADAEREKRALATSTIAGGGALVPVPLANEIVDLARAKMRVIQAGARTLLMESATERVARQVSDPTVTWRAEAALIPESQPTFDQILFQARTLSTIVKLSWEVLEDAHEIDRVVSDSLSKAVALEVDRAALRGIGAPYTAPNPEPAGVLNTTGVTVTPLGAGNGAAVAWEDLSRAVQTIRQANGEPNAFIHSPRTAGNLSRLKNAQGQWLGPSPDVAPLDRLYTAAVPNTLTVGTATAASEIYLGQWDALWLGLRSQMMVRLVERYADTGQTGLLIWWRGDIQLQHPQWFNVLTGCL